MPKRNPAYMATQRDHIAGKALEVMLEKGVADTSIRDICVHAGVSIGAFYTHFADRQEAVFAACAMDVANRPKALPAMSWDRYAADFLGLAEELAVPAYRRRLRLSFQFLAELAMSDQPLPLSDAVDHYIYWFRDSLRAMADAGEIALPLGLERTTWLHAKLFYGTLQIMIVDKARDRGELLAELIAGLALIAGRD